MSRRTAVAATKEKDVEKPTKSEFALMLEKGLGQFVVPSFLVVLHVYFLFTGYGQMVGKANPLGLEGQVGGFQWNTLGNFTSSSGVLGIPGWQPWALVAGYLATVFYLYTTRENRVPVDVQAWMFIYNLYETVLSLGMFVLLLSQVVLISGNPLDFTMKVDRSATGSLLAWGLWVNYQSKFLEFFDTLFMLLRNKPSSIKQVSPLHVIHHAIMGPIMWLIITYAPGGNSYFGPCINSFIHTVMYSYYLFTSLGIKLPWKQYITQMQIIQFLFIMVHSIYHIAMNILSRGAAGGEDTTTTVGILSLVMGQNTYWPSILAYTEFFLMILMLKMFGDFYKASYEIKKLQREGGAAEAKKE